MRAVERRPLQAETHVGIVLEALVLEGAVELLVAHAGEERGGAEVGELDVLEMALEDEGDLDGTLGGGEWAGHVGRVSAWRGRRQGLTRADSKA